MKKLCLLLFAITSSVMMFAQKESGDVKPAPAKNMVKINLAALAFKNISFQYERAIARKITVAGTFRYMPTGTIPFKNKVIEMADDPDVERQLNNLHIGNIAFMPEIRYYFSRKGAFRGFYLGAYANIAKYNTDLIFEYEDGGVTKTIPMDGHITGITGGLMIGAQFKLVNKVYLDWWVLGPGYGSSNGGMTGQKSLTPSEQQSLIEELEDVDIPLTDFTYVVNANGVKMDIKGPWAGIRAGICIAFRF